MPLLDWHTFHGFPGVSEKTKKDVLTYKGASVPEEQDELDCQTLLTLACMSAVQPDLSDQEATACLNRGFLTEHPEPFSDLSVDPDALSDVVDKTEAKDFVEKVAVGGLKDAASQQSKRNRTTTSGQKKKGNIKTKCKRTWLQFL